MTTDDIPETAPDNVPEAAPANPPQDNRRRLQQLLSVPERDRTDEQWDEIVELEIRLAPGNRADAGGGQPGNNNRREQQGQGKPFGGQPGKSRHPQKSRHFGGQGNKNRKPPPKQTP